MRCWPILVASCLACRPVLAEDAPEPESASAPMLRVHLHADGAIRDTLGTVAVPRTNDAPEEELPACFDRVDYLTKHNDPIMAISYLRQIVTKGDVPPQLRSRAIIELADVLAANQQEAEALCWLKLWTQLNPGRPEYGAVAYRIGSLYSRMGMADLARDAYYLALGHTVNQGQIQDHEDLKYYQRLTNATLWAMAANEYQSGKWARGAELFQRFRNEANSASDLSIEKASFLQADCYYQAHNAGDAIKLYEETLAKHPFNPLAPQSRLRLYHLYIVSKAPPEKAKEELEALAWTVRTVWPKDEAYWQKQTAQLLLALNQKNTDVLPPLVQKSALLPTEGKTWQDALNHYDALVSYQSAATRKIMDKAPGPITKTGDHPDLSEQNQLVALNRTLDQLLPSKPITPTH